MREIDELFFHFNGMGDEYLILIDQNQKLYFVYSTGWDETMLLKGSSEKGVLEWLNESFMKFNEKRLKNLMEYENGELSEIQQESISKFLELFKKFKHKFEQESSWDFIYNKTGEPQ